MGIQIPGRDRCRTRVVGRVAALSMLFATSLFATVLPAGIGRCESEPETGSESSWRWDWIGSLVSRGETPRILAQGSREGRLAIGDDSGVSILRGARQERAALVGVHDLVFDRDGTLWVATADGLYRWADGQRPMPRALQGGQRANFVHRVVANDSGLLVATEGGAFWSTEGRIFQPLVVGGTSAPVTLVAMEPGALALRAEIPAASDGAAAAGSSGPPNHRLWMLRADQLFELSGFVVESGFRVFDRRMLTLPRPMDARPPVDLVLDPSGRRLHLVFEDVIASRPVGGAFDRAGSTDAEGVSSAADRSDPAASGAAAGWRIERPVLPPGARIRRLAWGPEGNLWIATDRGLLEARSLASQAVFRPSDPLGASECKDLQSSDASSLIALCRRGLYLRTQDVPNPLSLASTTTASSSEAAPERPLRADPVHLEPDPPLSQIRARAIQRAGISVARSERLVRGLHRRAYWPDLSLRVAGEYDKDHENDAHQSFSSGDTRDLIDQKKNRDQGIGAWIQFDWDLGGIVYPEDAVDLSRELRQVISLRDDIADEINQLYYERQGIRERLASGEPLPSEEIMRLRLRAGEIEAGLDAWTGGWLSHWRSDRCDDSPLDEETAERQDTSLCETRLGPDDPVERKKDSW